ncbi:MAG: ribbon-helix-helix domain-containing protein [Candidatus Bathyarchaeia archaeon]
MKMIPEYEKLVCVRMPAPLKSKIDKLVASGKFKTASEVIRSALEGFLREV